MALVAPSAGYHYRYQVDPDCDPVWRVSSTVLDCLSIPVVYRYILNDTVVKQRVCKQNYKAGEINPQNLPGHKLAPGPSPRISLATVPDLPS